jgi:regulator of replication initiation timing
LIQSLNAKIS